jgi:hypothetical protein
MVKENGNSAWIVIVHPDSLNTIPDSGLWHIINYATPYIPHEELIWGLLRDNWPKPEPVVKRRGIDTSTPAKSWP